MAKRNHPKGRDIDKWRSTQPSPQQGKVRIIGGRMRGRQLHFETDPRTRPMKDSVREALYNLIGGWVADKVVIDLFAGTGVAAFEALSRGATHAILIEQHFPTAKLIEQNAQELGVTDCVTVFRGDAIYWARRFAKHADLANAAQNVSGQQEKSDSRAAAGQEVPLRRIMPDAADNRVEELLSTQPWVVLCCPPYRLYVDRKDELLEMLSLLVQHSPPDSLFAVESDSRLSHDQLPSPDQWRTREYSPVWISVLRKTDDPPENKR